MTAMWAANEPNIKSISYSVLELSLHQTRETVHATQSAKYLLVVTSILCVWNRFGETERKVEGACRKKTAKFIKRNCDTGEVRIDVVVL